MKEDTVVSWKVDGTLIMLLRKGLIKVKTVDGEDRYYITPEGLSWLKERRRKRERYG